MSTKEANIWDRVFKALDEGKPVRELNFVHDELDIVK
jgi:hypothetical protein